MGGSHGFSHVISTCDCEAEGCSFDEKPNFVKHSVPEGGLSPRIPRKGDETNEARLPSQRPEPRWEPCGPVLSSPRLASATDDVLGAAVGGPLAVRQTHSHAGSSNDA